MGLAIAGQEFLESDVLPLLHEVDIGQEFLK